MRQLFQESELSSKIDTEQTESLCWKGWPCLFNLTGFWLGCHLLACNFHWWKMRSRKFAPKNGSSQFPQGCLQNIWTFRRCCSSLNIKFERVSKLRMGGGRGTDLSFQWHSESAVSQRKEIAKSWNSRCKQKWLPEQYNKVHIFNSLFLVYKCLLTGVTIIMCVWDWGAGMKHSVSTWNSLLVIQTNTHTCKFLTSRPAEAQKMTHVVLDWNTC